MPDFEQMYFQLAAGVADAIEILTEAALEGEKAYLEAEEHCESAKEKHAD